MQKDEKLVVYTSGPTDPSVSSMHLSGCREWQASFRSLLWRMTHCSYDPCLASPVLRPFEWTFLASCMGGGYKQSSLVRLLHLPRKHPSRHGSYPFRRSSKHQDPWKRPSISFHTFICRVSWSFARTSATCTAQETRRSRPCPRNEANVSDRPRKSHRLPRFSWT